MDGFNGSCSIGMGSSIILGVREGMYGSGSCSFGMGSSIMLGVNVGISFNLMLDGVSGGVGPALQYG